GGGTVGVSGTVSTAGGVGGDAFCCPGTTPAAHAARVVSTAARPRVKLVGFIPFPPLSEVMACGSTDGAPPGRSLGPLFKAADYNNGRYKIKPAWRRGQGGDRFR